MKYMGSKRVMLSNGLGEAIGRAVDGAERVFDLFTGSAVVAWHIAERYEKQVIAGDLQQYACALATAVVTRTTEITDFQWLKLWIDEAGELLSQQPLWSEIKKHQMSLTSQNAADASEVARTISFHQDNFPISQAYAAHYFSPWQAGWLDGLRRCLPTENDHRSVALAALIQAASRCAASPGHTAQPFKPNETAGPYLLEAWRRDAPKIVEQYVKQLSARKAKVSGEAFCMDAFQLADKVREDDLVFLDPPYSGVHYSRFYHVLETVARGEVGPVSGTGRYPSANERPSSDFSITTKSKDAFDQLLVRLSEKGANVIITFPAGAASNGLTGDAVKNLAAQYFSIEEEKIATRFSTLGGDRKHRAARLEAQELIIKLSAH